MARRTSIEIYHKIESNGLLSKKRWEIYRILFKHGPLTSNEVFQFSDAKGFDHRHNTNARMSELRTMGVAEEVGEKICTVTGVNVLLWDVTDKLPRKIMKSKKIKCPHCKGKGFLEQTKLL